MNSDEYVELARELLDKMREFIRESEPGAAVIPLITHRLAAAASADMPRG